MTTFAQAEANWAANKLNRYLAEQDEYEYFVMWCEENDLDPDETDMSEYRDYVEDMKAEAALARMEDKYYDNYDY